MEEKVKKAFENLTSYTIRATEKAILELDKSILDKKNESVKSHLEQRQKELKRDLKIIRKYLERYWLCQKKWKQKNKVSLLM